VAVLVSLALCRSPPRRARNAYDQATSVTAAGLDVHARSTHAAAIDVSTGEVLRARFGPGVEEPVAWLAGFARMKARERLGSVRERDLTVRGLLGAVDE
jgi:hypothetical protein